MANGVTRNAKVSQKRKEVDEKMRRQELERRQAEAQTQIEPQEVAPVATEIPVLDPILAQPKDGAEQVKDLFRAASRISNIPTREEIISNSAIPMLEASRQLQEQNATRNEQRRAERDRRASAPIQSESTTMPLGESMAENNGPRISSGTVTKRDDDLMNRSLEDDIAALNEINSWTGMGVGVNPNAVSQGVTKMNLDDYYTFLENKHNLSRDEIDDLALTYRSNLNNEQSANLAEKAQKYGEEHPVLGSIASLPMTLANAVEGVNNVLVGGLTGDERRLSRMASGTKQGFREGTKENIGSNAGKVAYDLGMGLGDLGVGVATGQAPAILAGNTANEATLGAVDRGQNARKAALYGAGSGVADYITNTIGLDKAKALGMSGITAGGVKGFLKRMGIAAGAEAGENLIQDLAQTFLDEVINGEKSEIQTSIRERLAAGESVNDVIKETASDWFKDRGMSLATGALMGGAMYGGTAAINGLRGRTNIPKVEQAEAPRQEIPAMIPEEIARQNEIDVNEKIDNVNQAADEINNLAEQIPEVPETSIDPAHELAERYAASFSDFDTYDYMDNEGEMDGFVEQMADDIANERDLTGYIRQLEANIDDAPDEEVKAQMQSLADELKSKNTYGRLSDDEIEALKRSNEAMEQADEMAEYEHEMANSVLNGGWEPNPIDSDGLEPMEYAPEDIVERNRDLENSIRQQIRDLEMSPEMRTEVEVRLRNLDTILDRIDNAKSYDELMAIADEGDSMISDVDRLLKDSAQARLIGKYQFDEDTRNFINAINGTTIKVPDNIRGEFPDQTLKQLQARLHFYGEGKNYDVNLRKNSGTPIESLFEDIDNATGHALSGYMESQGYNLGSPEGQMRALIEYADSLKANQNSSKLMDYNGGIFKDYTNEYVRRLSEKGAELRRGNSTENNPPVSDDRFIPENPDMGRSKVITNTGVNSGVISPDDPDFERLAQYKIHHNDSVVKQAREDIARNRDEYLRDYANGNKSINHDIDVDRAMTLLQEGDISEWQRNSILRNMATNGTDAGQFIQAFAKYNNTAEGALTKAAKVNVDRVKKWKSSNKKRVETNNRIAQAINLIGKPEEPPAKIVPLTHEQLKERIIKTINDAFGEDAKRFNDNDIEYLTNLAETKKVPVRTITKELEHKLETGEWFTIDESLPVKAEKAIKNGTISNMLDRIVNGETPKPEKEPEAYGRFLKKIRNSLQDEAIGLGNEFDDTDVYFIGKMIQEKVPKDTIEDELRHRIETGEWYTIDESIEAPKPKNQKLQNAFKMLRGEDAKPEAEPKTFNQLRDEVKNTLEKNNALNEMSDADIDYLTNMMQQGASTKDISESLNTRLATGNWGVSDATQQRVNEIFEEIRHYDPNSEAFVERQLEAYKLLAEEVAPNATALEKFDTWRYMAMLGNPKTMLRNFVGNKLFSAVTGMSNNLAAFLERRADNAYYKRTGQHIKRTKEYLNPKADRELIDAAKIDAREKRYRDIEGSKYEKLDKDSLKKNRSVWNSKLMRLTEEAIDKGISDTNAVINKYATSLAGYMKANGLDKDAFQATYMYDALERASKTQLLSPDELAQMNALRDLATRMEKARDYALKQAEYSTFHEDNAVAQFLTEQSSKARSSDNGIVRGLGYALEGTIPFKKTPANILRSGFEYSPFGAIKSIAETGKLVYENTGKRKGNLESEYTKTNKLTGREKTVQKSLAADVIDSWSKTLTGTGLTALGYYLFNKGILTSSESGEKYQDQLEGKGNYAININGHTYTLDWAAPGVMPLLIGAEVSKVFKNNGQLDEEWYSNPDQWMQTINGLLDPMLETSMLSGLKDTLQNAANEVRYNEDGALGGILGSVAGNTLTGYATQAIPTLSGQIARTIDPTRRTTDTANEGILGAIEKQGRKVANKIPFLSRINPEYRDAYGRGQTNGPFDYEQGEYVLNSLKGLSNLAYQALSPGYYSKVNTTDADQMGRDIYNSLDENGLPIKDSKVFADWRSTKKINGVKLDPEQIQTFREEMGQANYGLRSELANNEWFQSLPATKQNEIYKSLNSIADKIGQYAVMPESVNVDNELKTYLEADGGAEGIKAVIDQMEYKSLVKDAGTTSNTKVGQAIQDAYDSGDMERVGYITDTSQILSGYGLKPAAQMAYIDRAAELIPGLDADTYGDLFQMVDTNGNGDISQTEIIDALPKLGATDNNSAMTLYQSFYTGYQDNSKVPEMQADGTFKAVNRKDDTQTVTQSSGQGFNFETTPHQEVTTLDPAYQPSAVNNAQYNTIDDVWTSMKDAGLSTSGATPYWNQALSAGATPQQFAEYFNGIDSALGAPNGGLKKDEWVAYLNNNAYDEAGDREIINMLYNTRWDPLKYNNGKWSK